MPLPPIPPAGHTRRMTVNSAQPTAAPTWRRLPATVCVLALVSLRMAASSELIHSLLPIFLVSVLGASAVTLGFIEGFAEATAAVGKVFSGVLSDWLGKRKVLT